MALEKHLLEKLRCPESQGELIYFPEADAEGGAEFLFCPRSKLRYRIEHSIPVMLVDEAVQLNDEECAALEARAAELGLA